jgi:hypothetical protein
MRAGHEQAIQNTSLFTPTLWRVASPDTFPMLGLKSFRTAAVVISGIELAEKIKKAQFTMSKRGGHTTSVPDIWRVALAV